MHGQIIRAKLSDDIGEASRLALHISQVVKKAWSTNHTSKINIEKVDESTYQIELKNPTLGVAPGQFGVIYQDTKLVGGGRITSKVLEEAYE